MTDARYQESQLRRRDRGHYVYGLSVRLCVRPGILRPACRRLLVESVGIIMLQRTLNVFPSRTQRRRQVIVEIIMAWATKKLMDGTVIWIIWPRLWCDVAADVSYRVEPREVKARLDSPLVLSVMAMGHSRELIRQAIHRRLTTTGLTVMIFVDFTSSLSCCVVHVRKLLLS